MLFHEYEIVREQTGDRLPPIDFSAYLNALGDALRHKTNAAEREQLKQILESYGWSDRADQPPQLSTARKLRHFAGRLLRNLRIAPARTTGFEFRDDEEAIRFALEHPLRPTSHSLHLETIRAEEVAA